MASVSELIENYLAEVKDKVSVQTDKLRIKHEKEHDPWGLKIDTLQSALNIFYPIFEKYFRVRVHGLENIPKKKNFIAVSNHSGQLPIDGALIIAAFIMEQKSPLLLRAMGERFLFKVPFLAKAATQSGTILGDRKNCRYLLEHGHSILAFPEGIKGITKSTEDFYKLQSFTHGFYRLALEKNVEILPITVIGAEEFYPYVYHSKELASLFNLPSFPITPLFPLAGILGLIPMPSPVDIYIGKPIKPKKGLSPNAPKSEIYEEVQKVKLKIHNKIKKELPKKRKMFDGWENFDLSKWDIKL